MLSKHEELDQELGTSSERPSEARIRQIALQVAKHETHHIAFFVEANNFKKERLTAFYYVAGQPPSHLSLILL